MPEISWTRLQELRHQTRVEAAVIAQVGLGTKIDPKLFLEEEKPKRRRTMKKPPSQFVKFELSKDNAGIILKILKLNRDITKQLLFGEKVGLDDSLRWQNEIAVIDAVMASIEKQL